MLSVGQFGCEIKNKKETKRNEARRTEHKNQKKEAKDVDKRLETDVKEEAANEIRDLTNSIMIISAWL